MHSVHGCKFQRQGSANITFQSLVASMLLPWCSSWVDLGEQIQNLFFICKIRGLPKTVGCNSQSSSSKRAASGRCVAGGRLLSAGSKARAERLGSMSPATAAPRPTLQTTLGSDMNNGAQKLVQMLSEHLAWVLSNHHLYLVLLASTHH